MQERQPFFPPELALFLRQLITRIGGLFFMLMGIFFFVALIGYDSTIASLDVASTWTHRAIMGQFWNSTVELCLQSFGVLSSVFFGFVLIRMGYMLLRLREWAMPEFTLMLTLLTIFFGATTVGLISPDGFGGGLIGHIVAADIGQILPSIFLIVLGLVSFGLFCYTGFYALHLRRDHIVKTIGLIASSYRWIVNSFKPIDSNFNPMNIDENEIIEQDQETSENVDKKPSLLSRLVDKKAKEPVKKTEPKKEPITIKPKPGKNFQFPPLSLLVRGENAKQNITAQHKQSAEMLETFLEEFGVRGSVKRIKPGPVVTLYEFEPAPGTKTSKIVASAEDIARSMASSSIRMAVIPGTNVIGVELPNLNRQTVYFQRLIANPIFQQSKMAMPIALGDDIGGESVYVDLAKMPHLMIAGRTGSGKSVFMRSIILSLLYKFTPDECKLIMIDPKMLEFADWNDIPHLLTPVVTDPQKAVNTLKWAVREMEDRYRKMSKLGVKDLAGYNEKTAELRQEGKVVTTRVQTGIDPETGDILFEDRPIDLSPMPYLVVIIDEMADLMLVAGKEVEASVQRLAQMARAAGIHVVIATQRPSVNVITGVIKANFPTRISFQTTSAIDSRTILDRQGAELLLDHGDMLYMAAGRNPIRVHAAFISEKEGQAVATFLRDQEKPEYRMNIGDDDNEMEPSLVDKTLRSGSSESRDDDLYRQAIECVVKSNKPSISYVQRCLRIGYNRAATLIERMEAEGIISPPDATQKRHVLRKDG